VVKEEGLYGAGQNLLKDAFTGNLHGLGPQVAEMEFEERPSEPFMILAADKTEPGAFNLPLYLAFADPMYSSGLLLSSELRPGFRFPIMDLARTDRDSHIVLDAPERLYDIAALLRDSHRFAIESIWSRKYGEIAAVVSTTRLRNIAGRYVGKDDPVALVRTQKIFPATEEFGPPFALAPFVAGDTRGSHHMPLMPVKANTPASTFFCAPMVCALGFSLKEGRLTGPVDLFADPVWDAVRAKVVEKAQEMRRQGFYGPAMLPMEELEYTGIAERLRELEGEFS
jgi:fructose 1,6-bisphosphate aldolase/phosphatase